jgi:hypothetical protein
MNKAFFIVIGIILNCDLNSFAIDIIRRPEAFHGKIVDQRMKAKVRFEVFAQSRGYQDKSNSNLFSYDPPYNVTGSLYVSSIDDMIDIFTDTGTMKFHVIKTLALKNSNIGYQVEDFYSKEDKGEIVFIDQGGWVKVVLFLGKSSVSFHCKNKGIIK